MLSRFSCVQLCETSWTVTRQILCPWDSPGKNTGVNCHALLQGIFPTQRLNPCLLHLPALASRFFTTSATWEVHILLASLQKIEVYLGGIWVMYFIWFSLITCGILFVFLCISNYMFLFSLTGLFIMY